MECITRLLLSENAFWSAVSALVSWGTAHWYYRKSLSQQSAESSHEIGKLLELVKQSGVTNNEVTNLERINEAVEEYRRRGTPVRVIDSYTDLNNEQKADIYDAVMVRAKGRLGKSNKYRKTET